LVGIADASPQQNIQLLGEQLDNETLPTDFVWLKRAIEDIKAYYFEAMTAQPGEYDSETIEKQFWRETQFGAAVLSLYREFQKSGDDQQKMIARILAPREAIETATDPERENRS